jgi:transcriptional regulator with XRE-family HTH domain
MPTPVALSTTSKRKARPGCELLAEWLVRHKMSATAFAEKIGVGQSALSKILLGDRRPSLDTALAIRDATKGAVPVDSWRIAVEPKMRQPRFRRAAGAGR